LSLRGLSPSFEELLARAQIANKKAKRSGCNTFFEKKYDKQQHGRGRASARWVTIATTKAAGRNYFYFLFCGRAGAFDTRKRRFGEKAGTAARGKSGTKEAIRVDGGERRVERDWR
jgi:hypothetical protein